MWPSTCSLARSPGVAHVPLPSLLENLGPQGYFVFTRVCTKSEGLKFG
jgi:hypothetical protein